MALIDNMVLYYTFDEASGDAIDSHGSNDGTLSGGVTQGATGKINDCYSFDGTNDLVTSDDNIGVSGSQDRTAMVWMYPDSLTNNRCWIEWGPGSTGRRFSLMFYEGGIRCEIDGGGYTTSLAPPTNKWSLVVVTLEGSTLADLEFYMYNSEGNSTESGSGANTLNTDNVPLRVGEHVSGNNFDGLIDEVGIWDRALSAAEIGELYNSGDGLAYPFAAAGTNSHINIGDAWKAIAAMKLQYGDSWKDISVAKINYGDSWKNIF